MTTLSDGTVIPSYLQVLNRGEARGWSDNLEDLTLRLGEVKALVYPDEELSYGKRALEYVVDVQYRNGTSDTVTSTYRGVTTSTVFGGVADSFRATLRPDDNTKDPSNNIGVGSKVVLLCVGGNQQKALILGGIQDTGDETKAKKKDGHNLFFEFNGVRFTVDKEGQPTLLFRGQTKVDGSLGAAADKDASGTKVAITKDGNLTVSTPDDKQILRLNHADKKIEIAADEQWQATVGGELKFDVKKDIRLSSSDAGMTVQTSKDVVIKSSGVKVGGATDAWMLGTTYRNQEQILHKKLSIMLQTLSTLVQTVGSTLQTASSFNATPVFGGLLAKPAFLAASALLQSPIPQVIDQMKSAIDAMEGQSDTYLSTRNKND